VETLTRPIFLLTDFGTRDYHVGQVKAVIAGIAPAAAIHDLTHDADPFAIDHGAWLLEAAAPALPAHAVVMAVVDPGVGTERRGIAVASAGHLFVGPDNGILSCAVRAGDGTAVELTAPEFRREPVAPTFHARDIFAPAAAHLAVSLDLQRLGPLASNPLVLPEFRAHDDGSGQLGAYAVHIDRFGNIITTVRASQLPGVFALDIGGHRIDAFVRTFAEAPQGTPVCYVDSGGFLGVAINQGSAAAALGITRGARVVVTPL